MNARSAMPPGLLWILVVVLLLPGSAMAETATPVRTAALNEVAVTLTQSAPATVESLNHTVVAAQISGTIDQLLVTTGDAVEQSTLLAEIDCDDYRKTLLQTRSNLAALDARLRLARQQLERAQKLLPTRNISEEQLNQRQTEYDMVQAEINAQKAGIDIAEHQVSKCRIVSPFAGVITQRLASQGAFVSPGTPIVEVLDTQRVEVSARLNLDIANELPDRDLAFVVDGQHFPLRIKSILPWVETGSRTREARLEFKDISALPGTPGRLVWMTARQAIPAYLLVSRDSKLGIFINQDGAARFLAIDGALKGRPAAVSLDADTRVITDGRHSLEHGAPINEMTDH